MWTTALVTERLRLTKTDCTYADDCDGNCLNDADSDVCDESSRVAKMSRLQLQRGRYGQRRLLRVR